jgi:hypothetical protein
VTRTHIASTVVSVVILAACAVETAPLGPAEIKGVPTSPRAVDAGAGSAGETTTPPTPTGERDASADDDATASADARAGDARPVDAGADVLQPPTPCDRDGDGRLAASCGGDDCCDTDPRAHKGASAWFDAPNACGSWDYDCDNKATREVAVVDCHYEFLDWCAGAGFQADTDCGLVGQLTDCQMSGLDCGPVVQRPQKQRCR